MAHEEVDVSVALVHHPPATQASSEWYGSGDQPVQREMLPKFDFILHEHEHRDETIQIKYLDREDSMVLSAGALYVGGGYPKTFKAFRFNLDSFVCQIYFWRYSEHKRAWTPDPGPQWPAGYVQALLGERLKRRHAGPGPLAGTRLPAGARQGRGAARTIPAQSR
jgi:hypothetical protein